MFCLEWPLASRVFPTIGFRIITELSSPEDLPRLESNELSNNDSHCFFIASLASFFGKASAPASRQSSAYRALSIAAKRAAFIFLRLRALGFSNRRRIRNCCRVCSRSSFFLRRRMAFSMGSPRLSFISVISMLPGPIRQKCLAN